MTATPIRESGGNLFADLDLPDAELHCPKAQMVAELYRLAGARNLTQSVAPRVITP